MAAIEGKVEVVKELLKYGARTSCRAKVDK